jgi:hypothetical protein
MEDEFFSETTDSTADSSFPVEDSTPSFSTDSTAFEEAVPVTSTSPVASPVTTPLSSPRVPPVQHAPSNSFSFQSDDDRYNREILSESDSGPLR